MPDRTHRTRYLAIAFAVLTAMLALSACSGAAVGGGNSSGGGSGAAPGVDTSTKTITVGASSTQTGAVAYYSNYNEGAQAYFDEINAKGGVGGWKISYKTLNDGYQPQQALSNVEKLVNSDHIFADVAQVGSPTNVASAKFLGNTKTPVIGCCSGVPTLSQYKNYFILEPNYTAEGATSLNYLVQKLHLKKIAVMYENDDLGQPALSGIQQAASKLGVKLVATVPFSVTDTNMTPDVSKVAAQNPDAVMIWGANGNVASAMKAGASLGVHATWIGSFFMADASTLQLGGSAVNGLLATEYFNPYTGTTPDVTEFINDMKKYEPKATIGAIAENGYDAAAMFVWGLTQMVNSGKAITQENLMSVMNSMNGVKFGTVSVPQSYSPSTHTMGYSSVQSFGFVKNENGKWVQVAPEQPFPSGLNYGG